MKELKSGINDFCEMADMPRIERRLLEPDSGFLVAVHTLTDCRFCLRCSPPFTHWASGISASKPPCLRSRISVENLLRGGSYTLNRQRRNPNQAHGCYMSESCLRW
ncbi:hypothetical protein T06_13718 [Trichinella sp. T6]|nr:hypothetical protein T06_13718 [Trichinella sp. T6]